MTKFIVLVVLLLSSVYGHAKKPPQIVAVEEAQAILVFDRTSTRIVEGFNATSQLPIASDIEIL